MSRVVFFKSAFEFRAWLSLNHLTATEIYVGYYKKGHANYNMSWSDSVDEALCFGWIDGVRKSLDEFSYQVRFTKRKKTSIWSKVNIEKVHQLIQSNKMLPEGLQAFEARTFDKTLVYSYEQPSYHFIIEYENIFKQNIQAYQFFQSWANSYKKNAIFWVMSAKRETTQHARLYSLIEDCALGINKWKANKWKKQ
jgi:uncharacterized protein YdeI (YjbR/CyaY-like superfamily)